MNALWIVAGCAALVFALSGRARILDAEARAASAEFFGYHETLPLWLRRVGMAECAAAACLVPPLVVERAVWISALSAVVLAAISFGSFIGFLTCRGYSASLANLVYASPGMFLAYTPLIAPTSRARSDES